MKMRLLSIFAAGTFLLASMLACNLGSSAPTGEDVQPIQTEPGVEAPSTDATEAASATEPPAANPTQGACSNPYLPVVQGATWNYTLIGPQNDTFTRSIVSVDAANFVDQDVFGAGVTRQGKWECDNGNLTALNPSGGSGTASIETAGMTVEYETTAHAGVTLPASINPGDSWSQSLTLEGTQSIGGISNPVKNQTDNACTAVGLETVTVPAGTFEAMRVDCTSTVNITVDFQGSPLDTTFTTTGSNWYAPGVGVVKIVTTGSELDSTVELTSYSIP
jgi:hypothetical protein